MAKSGRMSAVEDAAKDGERSNLTQYYWVDIDKMERFGLSNWAPKEGMNFISVIPPVDPEVFYAREVYVHYSVGGDKGPTHLCVKETRDAKTKKKWGKPCAVCDKRAKLAQREETKISADELKPSRRFLFYIIDTSDLPADATTKEMEKADKKICYYDGSPTFRDCVTGASKDKRGGGWVDVSDPDNGKTVCFDRVGKGMKTRYKNFALEPRVAIPDSWLEVPDYDAVLLIPDYDEVAAEVDLIIDTESPTRESSPRSRASVADDAPSEDEPTPRRGRETVVEDDAPSEDEPAPARSRAPREEPKEEPKEEVKEGAVEEDEVEAIKRRIRKKRE